MSLLLAVVLHGEVDTLTINRALERARGARPTVTAAAAAVNEARAHWQTAGTVPNPLVAYSHTGATPRQHLTIQQPFDWLFRREADRGAAAAGIDRARADSARIMAELDGEVRRAFYGTLAATESLRLIETEALFADSLVTISARRLALGDIAAMDHDRVRLEAARVRQLVARAREGVALATLGLRRVLAWPLAAGLELRGDLRAGLTELGNERPLADLPSVAAARADSVTAAFRVKSIRRGRLPAPAIEFGADWSDPALPGGGPALWLFGLSLPLPVWNRSGGELAAAAARSVQANTQLAETRLAIDQQVAEAALRVRQAALRALVAADSLVPAGRRLRAQVVLAYRLGETGVLPVLDALRAEREIESAALEDLLAFQEARALWYALVGSGDSR